MKDSTLIAIGAAVLAGAYVWTRIPNINPLDSNNVVNQFVTDAVGGEEKMANGVDLFFSSMILFTPLGLFAGDTKKNYAKHVIFNTPIEDMYE